MKKWLFLLRAFFPSWKFFDDVGAELRLEVRVGPANGSSIESPEKLSGNWINCLPEIPRSFQNLFFNPEGNHLHACHNLLSHLKLDILESDAAHPETVLQKATYMMTHRLAEHQIHSLNLVDPPFWFQFRVLAHFPANPTRNVENLLISPIYKG